MPGRVWAILILSVLAGLAVLAAPSRGRRRRSSAAWRGWIKPPPPPP